MGTIATTGTPVFLVDGEALRREASRKGLHTDRAIARALGCNQSTLSRVIGGRVMPSAELLARLWLYFGRSAYSRIVYLGRRPELT